MSLKLVSDDVEIVTPELSREDSQLSTPGGVYLAIPCHSPEVSLNTLSSVVDAVSRGGHPLQLRAGAHSLLTSNFNRMWCEALNMREQHNIRYFAMLHSDLGAIAVDRDGGVQECWLSHLIRLLEELELDAISAVVPIKEVTGEETSTAGVNHVDGIRYRLSQKTLAAFPQSFSAEWFKETTGDKLLINTGMMVLRTDRPWCEELKPGTQETAFSFRQVDWINLFDGEFFNSNVPEDWGMSAWFEERGIPYGCTTEIAVAHQGHQSWAMGGMRK